MISPNLYIRLKIYNIISRNNYISNSRWKTCKNQNLYIRLMIYNIISGIIFKCHYYY
jgi:hypothetical protein